MSVILNEVEVVGWAYLPNADKSCHSEVLAEKSVYYSESVYISVLTKNRSAQTIYWHRSFFKCFKCYNYFANINFRTMLEG